MQGYQKEDINGEKLAKDVGELLESAIDKANQAVFLQISNVKGQIIIKWEIDGRGQTFLWS